jgi:hypothetical protein
MVTLPCFRIETLSILQYTPGRRPCSIVFLACDELNAEYKKLLHVFQYRGA